MEYFMHTEFLPEAERVPSVAERGKKGVMKIVDFLETCLGERRFLLGDRFSLPDILVGGSLNWIAAMKFCEGRANLLRYVEELKQRPAFQRATAD
jgi:glutathione S-transferase